MSDKALLALEDGSLFFGESIGLPGEVTGEVVFNTAMTGYQEILTDPSYCRQIVALTYPHIGNVGTNPEDEESRGIYLSGLVVRDVPPRVSSWRSRESLGAYLIRNAVVGIADIDTRQLTRILRDRGAQRGCLVAGPSVDPDTALARAREFPGLAGMDLASQVTVSEPYRWEEGVWTPPDGQAISRPAPRYRVVAYDYGVKHNILRILVGLGCEVQVVPAAMPASQVLAMEPDGVFLSNGPGDPEPCTYAIEAIQGIMASGVPLFGICLGHQLLALACGARTVKMKFGHHGANHPVQALDSGRVMISSQNHGFAVDEQSLPPELKATHRSLFDGSLQGIHHHERPAFGFQGHPEASPGPHDARELFDHFIELMDHSTRRHV